MRRLRLYLDSTILITFVFGAKLEPERFNDVSILFRSKKVEDKIGCRTPKRVLKEIE